MRRVCSVVVQKTGVLRVLFFLYLFFFNLGLATCSISTKACVENILQGCKLPQALVNNGTAVR